MKRLLATCLLVLLWISQAWAKERVYYIGIKEVVWDYCPTEMNVISGKPISKDKVASMYLQRRPDRIGRLYKKAIYYQYADISFTQEIEKPVWLGFLGPIIKAETGDRLVVHFKNSATRNYTMHPHGVRYTKTNEGALYPDNTTGKYKNDDMIPPGKIYTYRWDVVVEHGPAEGDQECVTRIYHSHIDTPIDISSGAIGPLIICKAGVLSKPKAKPGIEFVVMFSVFDENMSKYLDENIATYCTADVDKEDADFQESNRMHCINGYMYGNLPGLIMNSGEIVRWHLFGIGDEVDVHSAYFHGQTLTDKNHRVDTINLFPATLEEAKMVATTPGKWLLSCQVNAHIGAGMLAIYEVRNCTNCSKKIATQPHERHYYIAAEEIIWNYGPSGINQFTGKPLDDPGSDSAKYFERDENRIGGSYKKALYVEYTDSSFTKCKERTPEEEHLGSAGPVIRGEVGDVLIVTFMNKAEYPFSIQAHGVSYNKKNEGALYKTNMKPQDGPQTPAPGSQVNPGEKFTYHWYLTEDVGPTPEDPPCLTWPYYSAVDPVKDTSSGLVGPLTVCRKGALQEENRTELFLIVTVVDENLSWYLNDNIQMFTTCLTAADKEDPDFQASNQMYSINGYVYGNQPGLDMCLEDTVWWHVIGLGTETDIHGMSFYDNTFSMKGTNRNTVSLLPHTSYTVKMVPDTEGRFTLACLTTGHFEAGMKGYYRVNKCHESSPKDCWHTVKKYIAIDIEEWDYSPTRTWESERYGGLENSPGNVYLNKEDRFIGSKYKKAKYREYTDGTFKTRKELTPEEEHLGILGPLIRGNVGDRIEIVLKNNAKTPYSIHAPGVKIDNPTIKETMPGKVEKYIWEIPERSGPGEGESDCVTLAYFSMVDQVKDTFSGLVGPLVICRKSAFDYPGKRPDKHFVLLFMIWNENLSTYLDENIQIYSPNPELADKKDGEFQESNKMHGINGRIYGNLLGLNMNIGDDVNWHLIGLGNEVDLHTVHFHAHSFEYKNYEKHHSDVFNLFPGTYQTLRMKALFNGTWLLHCHVNDHITSGMETTYTVIAK
ncbi:hypothetical protein NDU88_001472 [Pleurodeles waltl]|uniref:ferroxidase n=1 Tax=Pleurodeles waltl TaxID=8319 RepID=A0AAV7LBI7_PLEWA|nr:hypothetical protein NDU88_001472 [Pleurodeles waltl]